MTWETAITYLLLAAAVAVTFAVTSFFLVCLAWNWFWKWLREEMQAGWTMLDKPAENNESCPCDCKCNGKGHDPRLNNWIKKP